MLLPSLVLGILFRSWYVLGKHSTAELHDQNPFSIISPILTVVWILFVTHMCPGVCGGQKTAVRSWSWAYTRVSRVGTWVLRLRNLEMCFKLTSPAARCQRFKVLLQQTAQEVVILLSCLFMNWHYKPGCESIR